MEDCPNNDPKNRNFFEERYQNLNKRNQITTPCSNFRKKRENISEKKLKKSSATLIRLLHKFYFHTDVASIQPTTIRKKQENDKS